ncbi:hypothetical protein IFM89_027960 [Coptis chinensis]|uniref:Fe2OG dioxygenase domain-containing protein n=1 Tax=Coptis chinensis TaxID=261450 RepID=A0A835IDW1_9MAGN|nr:hypothetical protein IFM89_027960 [Coptis chinensis]
MEVFSKPSFDQLTLMQSCKTTCPFSGLPVVDLSMPHSETIVKACEEFGFFKVINHGIPMEVINRSDMRDYVSAVRILAYEVLELLAEGLKIQPKDVFSKLLRDENSDSFFRINHYPPCPELQGLNGLDLIGFGEHTDPQLISVLRSNNVEGLQICLKDGNWVSVPADEKSFFFIVGDIMQVMTNGRFKSVKHRVLANSFKSRISMTYFGGPPLNKLISPLQSLLEGEESLYKELTWGDYIGAALMSNMVDNRISLFEKK